MASLSTDKRGNRRLQFKAPNGKRATVYLGKLPLRQAQTVKSYVERLIIAVVSGDNIDSDTAGWLAKITDELHGKLAAVGLVSKRERVALGAFVANYITSRNDVKPASKEIWRQGERSLADYFGNEAPPHLIRNEQAEAYKQHLLGTGLRPYTVRKRLQFAKMIFTVMVKRGLIQGNPFDGVQVPATTDQSRDVYVPQADILVVMDQAPDAEWRAILALSRFGGLRCPSEVLSLKWEHIHWDRKRITVVSPKTTRHPNGGQRVIPLFPELVGPLREALGVNPVLRILRVVRDCGFW